MEAVLSLQRLIAQRHAQGLGLPSQAGLPLNQTLLSLNAGPLLHLLLALLDLAPRRQHHVSGVQVAHELLPGVGVLGFVVEPLQRSLIHQFLDVFEHNRQLMGKGIPFDLRFVAVEPDDSLGLLVLNVLGADFESDRNAFEFPMIELPARIVVVPQVDVHSDIGLLEILVECVGSSVDFFLFTLEGNRHDDHLVVSCPWRQHQPFVVSVVHRHYSDRAGCETPTRLPHQLLLLLYVLEHNVKHFGEVLAEVVGSCSLNSPSVFGNPSLYG